MAETKYFKNKEVLITGGLGFIGSNLAIKLVELGAKVTIVDSLIKNFGGNRFNVWPIRSKLKIFTFDLRNTFKISRAVENKEIIFNLAGTLSHIDSMTNPFGDLDINCRAQLCLLESVRKFNKDTKIIFAGTRNQYGKALYLPIDEKHIQEPTDINGINSIAAEKYHFLYSKIYGLKCVSLRLTNTYGPRHQMMHPKQGVLNWFIREIIDEKQIKLFGGGGQIRDINYVDDVTEAFLVVAKTKKTNGKAYNLGGQAITLENFVKTLIKVYGKGSFEKIPFPKERKDIEVGNYVADTKRIYEDTKWKPTANIEESLKDTINYYLKYKNKYW